MSASPRPPIPSLIPESAPFTPEQRTWLNGLFAGLFGLSENVTPVSNADAASCWRDCLMAARPLRRRKSVAGAEVDDGAPWHDPAMPLPDRMKLAEGKPLPRRLMAAMAQQDCGQCGYNCKDYADALFAKSEKRLNLCVPGGKDTSRMLKQLYQELDGAAARQRRPAAVAATPEVPDESPARHAARPLPRQSGLRHLPLAPPPQQARLGKRNLAYRHRSCRDRSGLRRRRFHSAFFPPTITILSPRCLRRSTCRRIFRSVTARSAKC